MPCTSASTVSSPSESPSSHRAWTSLVARPFARSAKMAGERDTRRRHTFNLLHALNARRRKIKFRLSSSRSLTSGTRLTTQTQSYLSWSICWRGSHRDQGLGSSRSSISRVTCAGVLKHLASMHIPRTGSQGTGPRCRMRRPRMHVRKSRRACPLHRTRNRTRSQGALELPVTLEEQPLVTASPCLSPMHPGGKGRGDNSKGEAVSPHCAVGDGLLRCSLHKQPYAC